MNKVNITFIGSGNMAASLIGGLLKTGFNPQAICSTDPDKQTLAQLQQRFQINTTTDNQAAAKLADILIFAVKPQVFAEVAQALSGIIQTQKPLVISIAAGINMQHLQQWLGQEISIVRCMPNTPALVGYGATGMYANPQVSVTQRQYAEQILQAVGLVLWLEQESLLDIVTALSGSGPAYFFLMMEALIEAAVKLGLPATIAQPLTMQTALGAVQMASSADSDLATLRRQVTSPGGTTEQAVNSLEAGGIRELFLQALAAAKKRSIELSS